MFSLHIVMYIHLAVKCDKFVSKNLSFVSNNFLFAMFSSAPRRYVHGSLFFFFSLNLFFHIQQPNLHYIFVFSTKMKSLKFHNNTETCTPESYEYFRVFIFQIFINILFETVYNTGAGSVIIFKHLIYRKCFI